MEQARKLLQEHGRGEGPAPERPRTEKPKMAVRGIEDALRLALVPNRESAPEIHVAAAIDLVRRAASAVRAREDRADQIEAHAEALGRRAHDEMKAAQARAESAEARALAAEQRCQQFENRLREAEEWVTRLCGVLEEEFPSRP